MAVYNITEFPIPAIPITDEPASESIDQLVGIKDGAVVRIDNEDVLLEIGGAPADDTYTKEEVDGLIPTELSELSGDANHRTVTDSEKDAWGDKYDKPTSGIPKSDLSSGVQTSLGKADSAYQKASSGIPETDLASDVLELLEKADSAYHKPTNGIPGTDLADGSITSQKLSSGAVTEGKIASNAVTSGKIASNAVTESKISNGAVSTNKIADGAVTEDKLDDDAVTLAKIANSAIDTAPTEDSDNLVTSGGVYEAIENMSDMVDVKLTQKADKTVVNAQARDIANLKAAAEGKLYVTEEDDDEAYQKTVPTGALPFAMVKSIGGKSVVWNQMMKETSNNFLVVHGVSSFSDGVITFNGNGADFPYLINASGRIRIVNGHKYYYTAQYKASGTPLGNVRVGVYNGTSYQWKNITLTDNWAKTSVLYTALADVANDTNSQLLRYEAKDTEYTLFAKDLHLIDLTKLFGSGNEPITVDDPRIALIEHYAAEHPEYNAGEILSGKVENVKSEGKNLFTQESYINDYSVGIGGPDISTYKTFLKKGLYTLSTDYVGTHSGVIFCRSLTSGNISVGEITNSKKYDVVEIPEDGLYRFWIYPTNGLSSSITNLTWWQLERGESVTAFKPYRNPISHPIDPRILALEGYGESNGTDSNVVDYGEKVYHKKGYYSNGEWVSGPEDIDLSDILTDDFAVEVEAGGTLTFEQEDDTYLQVPSTEVYMIKIEDTL